MIPEEIGKLVDDVHQNARQIRMKADFQRGIENDYAYIKGLQHFVEKMEAVAVLKKKEISTREFQKQPEEWKAEEMMDIANLEVQLNETREKLHLQKKVLADKVKHFTDVFLPMYEKRLAEVEEKWEQRWDEVEQAIWLFTAEKGSGNLSKREVERLEKLIYYRDQFFNLPDEERKDLEIKSNYYFIFLNLLPKA